MSQSNSNIFNPFPGLRPFSEEEDYLFFGREQQVAELVTLLRNQRFIAVTGSSGSGKSSLVRAGLLPELQGGMMKEVGSDWETLVLRPGGAPLTHLAEAVAEASMEDPEDPRVIGELLATLNHSGLGLVEAIRQSEIEPDTNVLVLIDQFEEIFRFQRSGAANQEQAVSFINLLLEAGAQRDIPIFVIITMRSDYLGDCTEFRGLAEAVNEGEYLIPRLSRDQIRSCIEGPIKVGGGQISFALVQELLNSLGTEQDQLPVLQHALMRTFDKWKEEGAGGDGLDLSHYQSVGGMEQALSRHADEVFGQFNDQIQVVAKSVFKSITERGVDNRGIRRPTRLDLLTEIADAELEQVVEVVDAFRHPGVTFLMPPTEVPLSPETVVDISHESLMRVWVRLKEWVDDEAQSARIYRRLTETAELHGQGRAGLYRDPDLQIALSWRESEAPTSKWALRYASGFEQAMVFLTDSEESALAAEREREAARQRELEQAQALAAAEAERAESQQRAAKRLKILSTGVAAVAVVALIAFLFAVSAQRESIRQRGLAEQNAEVAEKAMVEAEENARSAIKSQELAESAQVEAENAAIKLNETLTRSQFVTAHEQLANEKKDLALAYLARSLRTDPNYWQAAAQIVSLLSSNNFPIEDEKTLEQDQPFRYWGLDDSKSLAWTLADDLGGFIWDATDGSRIAPINGGQPSDWPEFTASSDLLFISLPEQGGSIVGLSTETGEAVTPVMQVSNRFNRPYFVLSRDADNVRILLDDIQTRQLLFWNGKTGESIPLNRDSKAPLVEGKTGVSADHRYIFAAYADQTITLWKASDGQPIVSDFKHGMGISDSGMSPDSRWLFVSSGIEQTVAWMDLSETVLNPKEKPELQRMVFEFPVRRVAFHPEKPWLLVAGRTVEQGMIRVLDLESGEIVSEITEDDFGVQSQESIAGMRFLGYKEFEKLLERWIVGIASQNGRQLRICDLESGKEIHRFDFDDSKVQVANFTPDGSRLITTHVDRTLRIWDVFSGLPVTSPIEHPFEPSFSISEDGQKVITFNVGDLSMRVFSTRTGQQLLLPLPSVTGGFTSRHLQLKDRSQFISSERTELTVQGVSKLDSGLLSRWSAKPRQARRLPQQFDGTVYRASFSPDGTQAIAGGAARDTKVKIWNVADGKTVRTIRHGEGVNSAIFNGKGDRIATASSDGVVRLWKNQSEDALEFEIVPGGNPNFMEFDSSGKRILITTLEGNLGVWDADSGFPVFDPINMEGDARFSINGEYIVFGGGDGYLRLIDSQTGEVQQVGERASTGVAFGLSPDGIHVSTSAFGDFLKVWNLATGELEWKTPRRGSNLATVFHPSGDLVAVCNSMNSDWQIGHIDLWNWRTGERPVEALECEGQVYPGSLSFSPDGRFIAAGTVNGRLNLWEVSTGKKLYQSRQHTERIWTLAFSSDSKRLLTSGEDGTVNIYELPPVNDPIPEWLPLLAERVAKKRINESGAVEAVSAGLSQLKASIDASTSSDGYTRWAKWFFKDPLQRDADHSFDLTTQEFTDIKSRGSSLLGQYDAFLLEPNNGLIACRIGYLLAVSPLRAKLEQHAQTQWDESALWYCEQGTELSSESGEAWALKGAVEQVLGKSAEESVARALELEPEAPIALYVNAYELHQQGLAKEAYAAFTRAISLLPENRHQLDWENQAPFLVGTLRQILSPKTFSPFVLAQAGVAKLFQTGDTLQRRKVEADWLTRYACELGPDDARVWRMRAQVLASAEKEEELKLAIAKSIEHDEGGSIDWHQYGRLLNERCNELVSQKRFDEAHQYVMQSGIPSRSIEATPDQIDLSSSYNQALIQTPYRLRTQNNNADRTWNRLPIGLVSIDDVLFDVRGMVRLGGGIFANKEFPAPVPRKVSDIGVNRTAEYVHFLHNVAAETSRRTPRGEVVGYYTLTYEDNEQVRLPIRYGKDVIPWVFNSFVKPTRAAVGFAEGHYQSHKTLCHSIWENPRPEARIRSIDFESTNSHSAPFLIAISLESDTFKSSSGDGPSLSSRAYRRSFLTQGQTEKTKSAVDDLSNRALVLEPEDVELAYQRAEVLFQIGKFDEALEMASSLAEQHPERTAFRILEGRVLFKMGRAEEAASRLQRRSGEQPFEICFTQDESLIWDQFTEDVYAQLGEFEGRNFLFKLNIPNRSEDASSYLVDLSEHYNANLEESFFTPRNYPSYTGAFFNRLQPGIHVLEGTPFDIRGVIQLNDRETIAMNNVYPKGVEGIQVGVEGDQVHFLHATFNNDRPGTPTIGYQIHLSNGDVHQHIVRFGIDINDMARDHDTDSPESAIWRAPNITPFAFESDALLHQSTWNNPTPQHTIAHIDARIGVSRAQPFLAAITVESFERQLNRKPEEILQVAQNALRKIKQAYAVNPVVMKYVREVVQKIEAEGMANAEALQTLARIYYRFEEYGKALKAIDASLSLDTGNRAESLRLKSEVLGAMKEFSSARKIQEAIRQAVLDENIVKRGEGTDSRFVDLSSYYNVTLQEFPYQTEQSTRTLTETFDQITPGVSTFAGIEFDVRGIVALSGTETLLSAGVYDLKQEISGVRVDRKASSIHLLHGAGWGDSEPHGTCIGEVILNYEDGENHTIEICAGMHVRDWFLTQFFDRNVSDGKLAWVHPSSEVSGRDIGLYSLSWENPKPDKKILSMDYRSSMTKGAPFLLGVTLED